MFHTGTIPAPGPNASVHPPETKWLSGLQYGYASSFPHVTRFDVIDPRPPNFAQTFRHSGWLPLRTRVYRALRRTHQAASRISAFADCGSQAYLVRSLTDPSDVRVAGSSCHDRFCVPCANERSRAITANVIAHLGTTRVRFLTLTVKTDTEPLTDCLAKLYDGFLALRRSTLWRRRVKGGVAFVELKYNPDPGRWHPHIHALITGSYIPLQELKRAWLVATGDSHIVHIARVHGSDHVARYCAKYASKPLNRSFSSDDERLDEAILALKGRRLATTFGGWRKVLLVDHPDESGWENIGSLDSWITKALHGDEEARLLIQRLDAAFLPALLESQPTNPRPPPPEKKTLRVKQPSIEDWLTPLPSFNP